jgi:hypothetical protein
VGVTALPQATLSLAYGYENQGFQPILAYFIEIKPKQLYHILMR